MNKKDYIFSQKELLDYLISNNVDLKKFSYLKNDLSDLFLIVIPKYYLNLINWKNQYDPLLKMVIPNLKEKNIKKYELTDPIGDKSHEPVPGIIHRYPDRLLFMLTSACAVHCRFCFRKNILSNPGQVEFQKCLDYIKKHEEVWEVIFSGGDPFTIPSFLISKTLGNLNKLNHIKIVRFHTRVPAIFPLSVTDEFISALKFNGQIIVVVHINHAKEITQEFKYLINKLHQKNIMLLSQTVLMKGVNSTTNDLTNLFKKLVEVGVKPYYLHHLDKAAGTDYFRVSVEKGKSLMRSLRGHISGHCIPEYVIDLPDGSGKIPVFWFKKYRCNYHTTSFEGSEITYKDPSLEK